MPAAAGFQRNQSASSPAPAKPGRGGARPGAGRKRGKPNLASPAEKRTLEALAKQHAETALAVLVEIATTGASEAARVTAATALLDRGYGKPRQAVEHSGEGGGPLRVHVTREIIDPACPN